MLDFGFYNMDCLEGMKEFPDKYFDLAIVDPPYGNPGGGWKTKDGTRFGPRFDRYREPGSEEKRIREAAPAGVGPNSNGGGTALYVRTPETKQQLPGPAEHGPRSSEKNYRVGYSAGKRIFRRAFPYLTQSDYMGGELFPFTTDPLFSDLAQANYIRKIFYVNGGICLDEL